jgi:hypothetical protein
MPSTIYLAADISLRYSTRSIMLDTFLTARLALIVPLILSTTSAILCALCLSAGYTPGFLEDFAIVRVSV